jgi:hypothetical protein
MSEHAMAAPGEIAPPPPGPWLALARGQIVGAVGLDADGATTQSTIANWVAAAPDVACARIADVAHYRQWWDAVHELTVQPAQGNTQRFHTRVDSTLFSTQGDQDRSIDVTPEHSTIWWRGVSGDYANDVQRWDFVRAEGGGSYVLFSGGSDYNRTGVVMRALVDNVPWMLPGYAAAWKMVWMRPALAGL